MLSVKIYAKTTIVMTGEPARECMEDTTATARTGSEATTASRSQTSALAAIWTQIAVTPSVRSRAAICKILTCARAANLALTSYAPAELASLAPDAKQVGDIYYSPPTRREIFLSDYITCFSPDIDDCALGPCENGGTCEDRVNAHVCHCGVQHYGENCQNSESVAKSKSTRSSNIFISNTRYSNANISAVACSTGLSVVNATINEARSTADVDSPGYHQTLVFECRQGHRFNSDLATERMFNCTGSDWEPNTSDESCEGGYKHCVAQGFR